MFVLCAFAIAADADVYRAAMRHIDERYLWPERIDHAAMFRAAADRLESRVEWLTVDEAGSSATLSSGRWRRVVRFEGDLGGSLLALDDAVHHAGLPLDGDLDLRAELLNGVLSTLDRHSVALAGDSLDRFDERLLGTLTGIGVTLRADDGHLTVIELFPDSPAEKGGLRAGDRLLRIDGISTVGMLPADATERIRGRSGTPVRVRYERGDDQFEATLIRAEVRIPNVTWAAGPRGTAVLRIDHFSEQTTANLEDAVAHLRSAGQLERGLVIDLRGNTGGSLLQSAKSADLFIDAGRLVMTAGRNGDKVAGLVREVEAKPGPQLYDGPIVVLMDHETASGAEILAGALAHLDRTILVGENTFGKGTVQTIYQLAEGLKIKLTVAEYVLDDDARVANVGLAPDLAMYPVDISESGVSYDEWARVRGRVGADVPLYAWPRVQQAGPLAVDAPLELAAELLESGVNPDRASLLSALSVLAPMLSTQAQTRLAEALTGAGIQWRPAGDAPVVPNVKMELSTQTTPRAGESVTLSARVSNAGPALEQAAIRLRSVNGLWDDLVLPIGSLAAGEIGVGTATARIDANAPSRLDRVVAQLECAGCTSAEVLDTTLAVEGADAPQLVLHAHKISSGVVLELENKSERLLAGVGASIEFPKVEGIELLPGQSVLQALAPGETATVEVPLTVDSAFAGATLPLTVDIRADGFGTFARWDLDLPLDGAALHRRPPEVTIKLAKLQHAPGTATFTVVASDTERLDHLVVRGGPQRVDRSRWEPSIKWDDNKLGYYGNLDRRVSQVVTVPVEPGTNRFDVDVEDKTGLRTVRSVYIYGDGSPPKDDGVALAP